MLDGYNNHVNTNSELFPLYPASYAGRLPGTVIAVRIKSSQLVDYMLNIDELMKKVHRTRFCTPVSQYSKTHKTLFTGTGLLTSDEIIRKGGLNEEIRRKMRGFRSDTSSTLDMLATSDIDPVDVTLHKAVVPQPSKRQWILRMSLDE